MCIVANEINSSEYEGSKGQQPVEWHCSSECNTVTEAEVAAIVHLKQAFEDPSHPIHPNTTLHFILITSTTPSIILLVPIRSHTSIHLQHYTSLYTIKRPTCTSLYTNTKQSKLRNLLANPTHNNINTP